MLGWGFDNTKFLSTPGGLYCGWKVYLPRENRLLALTPYNTILVYKSLSRDTNFFPLEKF